jgi:hypothetical protein
MEILGKGAAVQYERCVKASTARAPEPSQPEAKRESVAELLGRAGFALRGRDGLLQAVDAWRRERDCSHGISTGVGSGGDRVFRPIERDALIVISTGRIGSGAKSEHRLSVD